MVYFNLAAVRLCTEAEGPGKRFALWFQGCKKKCNGCCNPHMQPLVSAHIIELDDLKRLIMDARDKFGIEGITCVGGEPFLQCDSLAELAVWCHENGLSVLVFTGYYYSELLDFYKYGNENIKTVLDNIDILVDGPFVQELYDDIRDWVGSTNQNVILLTDKYESGVEFSKNERIMDLRISTSDIEINGWPFGI